MKVEVGTYLPVEGWTDNPEVMDTILKKYEITDRNILIRNFSNLIISKKVIAFDIFHYRNIY